MISRKTFFWQDAAGANFFPFVKLIFFLKIRVTDFTNIELVSFALALWKQITNSLANFGQHIDIRFPVIDTTIHRRFGHIILGGDGITARVGKITARVCVIDVSPITKRFVINTFFVQRGRMNVLNLRGLDKRRSLTGHGRRDTFITLDVVSFGL